MPNPIVTIPDAELALLQYLKGISQLTAVIPAAQMSTETPNRPAYPLLLVTRAGGTATDRAYVDEPALQVDVVGGDKRTCAKATQLMRAAILAIANDQVGEGVLVSAVEEVGPSWLPDTVPVPPVPRYTARYRVLLHN